MKTRILAGAVVAAVLVVATGCASKEAGGSAAAGGKLTLGAALSLTGSTAKAGISTKEGYEVCERVINDKGGITVGGKEYTLDILNPQGMNVTRQMGVVQIQNGKPVQVWPKDSAEAPLKWPATTDPRVQESQLAG